MRFQRLLLASGSVAFQVPFHPRLTVIAGVGRAERDGLVGELLGAMSGTRRGSTLEVIDDTGRQLVVTRAHDPAGDRVVEADTGLDVTQELVVRGRVDLLAALGLSTADVRRRARITAADVAAASRSDALLSTLARLDQPTLWRAAERIQATDAFLKGEAEGIGASAEDAEIIEQIEVRHARFEAAQALNEKIRHLGVFTGGACAIGGVPAALLNRVATLGFMVAASATLFIGIVFRRRMERARRLETEALAAAGAESYMGFHIQRMNQLLEGQANRRRLVEAAGAHREAVDGWNDLAGDVTVDWAIANRERVLATNRRMAQQGHADIDLVALGLDVVEPAELAQAFVARLADLRHAGRGAEGIPLILDDPLAGIETSVKQWMLELVGRSAGTPQCIYLTDDPDVAAWARMEAMAGHLAVIEPTPVDVDAA